MDWTTYLDLAQALYTNAGTWADREACLRSAISRAYYGAFGLARGRAAQNGLQLRRSSQDHQAVIRHFRQATNKQYQQIGLELSRLRRARNRADYDEQFDDLANHAQLALRRAQEIHQLL